jgi:hypothetical protein
MPEKRGDPTKSPETPKSSDLANSASPVTGEEYVTDLQQFLEGIGVTGKYFCAQQYERWRGPARQAFEAAQASAVTQSTTQKPRLERKNSAA